MAKPALVFVCAECGAETLKWQGQCPQCTRWNTLEQRTMARRPAAPAGPRSQRLTSLTWRPETSRGSEREWGSSTVCWAVA